MDNKIDIIKNCNEIRKLYDELVLDDIIAYDPKDKPDGVIFRKCGGNPRLLNCRDESPNNFSQKQLLMHNF